MSAMKVGDVLVAEKRWSMDRFEGNRITFDCREEIVGEAFVDLGASTCATDRRAIYVGRFVLGPKGIEVFQAVDVGARKIERLRAKHFRGLS